MISLYVDGASAGNPGNSGIGVVILHNNQQQQLNKTIGRYTNHEAEFLAAIWGLEQCKEIESNVIRLFSDSQAVISAIEKRYAKKEPYAAYLQTILTLLDTYELVFCNWIPRDKNKKADQLARAAIVKSIN